MSCLDCNWIEWQSGWAIALGGLQGNSKFFERTPFVGWNIPMYKTYNLVVKNYASKSDNTPHALASSI